MYRIRQSRLTEAFALGIVLVVGVGQNSLAAAATQSANYQLSLPRGEVKDFGTPPTIPTGELKAEVVKALNTAFADTLQSDVWSNDQFAALETIASSKDVRLAWLISDYMRIVSSAQLNAILSTVASDLMGVDIDNRKAWGVTTDYLIAWDIPAPPGYLAFKRKIFTTIVSEWE